MPIRFVKDVLPNGLHYPCTIRDLKAYLKLPPVENLRHVKVIKLSFSRKTTNDAWWRNGWRMNEIVLNYAVDKKLAYPFPEPLPDSYDGKSNRFGGTWKKIDDEWFVLWPDAERLKRYVRFILFHEIAHNAHREFSEEECDRYAFTYLDRI